MPATTNRGVVQLTPDTTLTNTRRAYLYASSPTLATVKSGLAVFAIAVIAQFCLSRLFTWFRRLQGTRKLNQTAPSQLPRYRVPWDPASRWPMDEKEITPPKAGDDCSEPGNGGIRKMATKTLAIDPNWKSPGFSLGDSTRKPVLSRPPPAPPLTPPELSTAVFTFEQRARPVDNSFMHQPNPDYTSTTSSSAMAQESTASPSIPRRRSYNKTLPVGITVAQSSSEMSDAADLPFSPSSYPPTSPLLPPPPPTGASEIDVQGEIIGVLDGDGAGWTRHTRVYGGGVCLACAASGGSHGGGGFYGATVRPEEMR